jgi:hypothetical protein
MSVLPQDTRRHARAAAREGFLAVRSLLSAIGDGIEEMLSEPAGEASTGAVRSGPAGTWGTVPSSEPAFTAVTWPAATGTTGSGKVRRIELSDEDNESTPGDSAEVAGNAPEESEAREGRGLRADIDY